jgi:hypothetical protein
MKNAERIPLYIIILVLIGGLAYLIFRKPVVPESNKVTVVVKYDSIPRQVYNPTINAPITFKEGVNNLPAPIIQILNDTNTGRKLDLLAEIINRYYEVRTQEITTANDSIRITTVDTLTENGIVGRKLTYKLTFPVSKETTIVKVKNRWFIGGSVDAGQNALYGINAEGYVAMKKGLMFGAGYNTYALFTGKDKYNFQLHLAIQLKKRNP